MANEQGQTRCRERLERLSGSTLDCESIRRETIAELQRVIGFDRWCFPLADPATLLPLSGLAEHDYGQRLPRALELEFSGNDFAAKHVLARRAGSAASLSAETGGDLGRSPRWDEVMRSVGIGDIATVACRDALGCWGWIEAYRDEDDPAFDAVEIQLLADVGRSLGSALRRASLDARRGDVSEPALPGVIVLDRSLSVVSSTPAARAWIDALPAASLFNAWGILPPVVYPVATLSRSRNASAGASHALERTVDGRWLMIQAEPLESGDDDGNVAVTLRGAMPSETFDLLCRVYALTRRERDTVAALIAGLDTRAITERLFISRHTVQDHLKSIFEKVGVHSRRELLATFNASATVC
ncbi:MAG: helix-turn-helix transcriptional regulator [Actinobacteria bacterium]|nr:MAG: helix-turn-helix transcriptional regulator [Actinomycetota bacterium]